MELVDDRTLEVQLTSEQPWFIQQSAHSVFLPVHQATVEKFGERWTRPVFRLFHPEVATIFAERRRLQSAPETTAATQAMYEALFPQHPYGKMLIGSYEDIRSEPFTELERLFDTWYVPNNAALFLAGDIDADTAYALGWMVGDSYNRQQRYEIIQ